MNLNIANLFHRKEEASEGSTPLSFSIENVDGGEIVEQVEAGIPRAILRTHSGFTYAIAPGKEIDDSSMKLLSRAKWHVIEQLSDSEDYKEFGKAFQVAKQQMPLQDGDSTLFANIVAYDTVGTGPFGMLLEDASNIEEIEVNTPTSPICVYHAKYGRCQTNVRFNSEEDLRRVLNKMIYESEKELNDDSPVIDVQVKDTRVHAQTAPYSFNGTSATIRIGGRKDLGIAYIAKNGTASFHTLAYIWLAVESGMNIVISGPPASGKTTLMTSILSFAPKHQRTIAIEDDVNELKFYSNVSNFVSLYGSSRSPVTPADQVINALRMRPDRIVVGELRGGEAKELFAGANFGVPFITTMHSNDGELGIIKRLLIRPMSVEENAISSLDVSIYMSQPGVGKRIISQIYEYKWLSRAEILEQRINIGGSDSVGIQKVLYNGTLDKKSLQDSKVVAKYAGREQVSKQQALRELEKRAAYLKEICDEQKSALEVINSIQDYGVLD